MQFLFPLQKRLNLFGREFLPALVCGRERRNSALTSQKQKPGKDHGRVTTRSNRNSLSGFRHFQVPPNTTDQGGEALCHYSPRITCVFVGKSQDICSSASALIDNHRNRWAVPHVLPYHQDHIGASFHNQPNYGYTLAHSCFKTHLTSYKQVSVTQKSQNIR